jgi:hypothetical protein
MNQNNFFVLKYSLNLLLKNPVLFLPKIVLALLYGFGVLLSADLFLKMVSIINDVSLISPVFFQEFIFSSFVLLFFTLINYFLDLFFSGLYPVLVVQAMNGKVSFSQAFKKFKPRIGKVFVSGTILLFLVLVVSFVEAVFLFFFSFSGVGWVISLVISFLFIFLFYFLFPVVVFKKNGIFSSFMETLREAFSNKGKVFWFSFIPFAVSLIKFAMAFFQGNLLYLIVFWLLVLLTAFVYSLHVVVNQVLYSGMIGLGRSRVRTASEKT